MAVHRLPVTLLLLGVIAVAFTQASATAKQAVPRDEQEENRRALFVNAGNQLRNWILVMLALFAAIFALLDKGKEFLEEVFERLAYGIRILLVGLLLSQCFYSFTRILWYAQLSPAILEAPEEVPSGCKLPPILLLKESAERLTRDELARALWPCPTDWIYLVGSDLRWWLVFTLVATAVMTGVLLSIAKYRVRLANWILGPAKSPPCEHE